MEDIIKLLPDSVANQIAAGEVIQQPSSVIKELVENSVDAGATKVDIAIVDAGRTLIQEIDNGRGMSPTDARLAFERHSTSKIRKADDLFSLHTMGFRGEALASIAAIAQVELRTMLHDASIGTRLMINGSRVESQEPLAMVPGTNFSVKNIFYNVPARRKFMKKDATEFANILREFERLALVNPKVEMSLSHNGELVHHLSPSNLKTRVGELFGRSVEDSLVSVEVQTDIINISGFVSNPSGSRRRGALQFFFVNGRNMKHPYFRKAVLMPFEKLISADSQPNFFISMTVDPQTIDVNIHPTKNEIKFEEEQSIWQLLTAAVREALGRFNLSPSIDFETPSPIEIKPLGDGVKLNHAPSFGSSYNPFKYGDGQSTLRKVESERRSILGWETLYEPLKDRESVNDENRTAPNIESKYIQLGRKYIATAMKDGIIFIDQHRAHFKILFNEYQEQMAQGKIAAQQLLFPVKFTIDSNLDIIINSIFDTLTDAGFELRQRGEGEWEILGHPPIVESAGAPTIISDVVAEMAEATGTDDMTTRIKERIATTTARVQSIATGQILTQQEMEHVVSKLFSLDDPTYDPNGNLIIAEMKNESIGELFNQ